MKCPCCGGAIDPSINFYFDHKLKYGGKLYTIEPGVGKLFIKLLNGTVTRPEVKESNVFNVQISRLRKFLLDERIPLTIPYPHQHVYRMVPVRVKNNNDAEHPKDVHS